MKITKSKTILDGRFIIGDKEVKKIELREYELDDVKEYQNNNHKRYSIMIYLETINDNIEMDYLGNPTKELNAFDEISSFLINYNGLSSTINRILIEMDRRI